MMAVGAFVVFAIVILLWPSEKKRTVIHTKSKEVSPPVVHIHNHNAPRKVADKKAAKEKEAPAEVKEEEKEITKEPANEAADTDSQ